MADGLVRELTSSESFELHRAAVFGVPAGDLEVEVVFDARGPRESEEVNGPPLRLLFDAPEDDRAVQAIAGLNVPQHPLAHGIVVAPPPAQVAGPVLSAFSALAPPVYAEVTTTLASAAVGLAIGRSPDRFCENVERALWDVCGMPRAKAITVVSPSGPPAAMTVVVSMVGEAAFGADEVAGSAADALRSVSAYAPGCRQLGKAIVRERVTPWGRLPVATVKATVEGTGSWSRHAGHQAVSVGAALTIGSELAQRRGAAG